MERKQFTAELKAVNGEGTGMARIAMLGPPPDLQNDILERGVLGGEQVVPLMVAHQFDRLPVGKTTVREEDGALLARFRVNMDMAAGRALHSALTFDLSTPPSKMEWSFSYLVKEADSGLHEGQPIRRLRRIELIEVSPVIKGAGRETMTLAIKSDEDLAARSAALVAEYERIRQRGVALAGLELLTRAAPGATGYGYKIVVKGTDPRIEKAAARFASWATEDNRMTTPEVRLFREARAGESPDFRMACKVIGVNFRDGTVAVDGSLGPEQLAETVAHEVAHANGADEREAEGFARKFMSTTYRNMGGGGSRAGRPMPGMTWDQMTAAATWMRHQGVRV